ncbi:MAG: ABC transporter permease [Oscillospiraceae bacterium]|nr:ABC transporter permease [Oscillospiraceae bacterium]
MTKGYVIVLKKFFIAIAILLVLSFIILGYIRLIPGCPVRLSLGPGIPEDTVIRLRSEMFLDEPLPVQWFYWIVNMLTTGNMGTSLHSLRDVSVDIAIFLPRSLELVIMAAIVMLVFSVMIGTFSALFKNTWLDNVLRILAYLGAVIPSFVFGILFLLVFGVSLRWFPIGGLPTIPVEYTLTGMPLFDSIVAGDFALAGNVFRSQILPVLSVSVGGIAYTSRLHRSSVIEILNADYIAFARVAGVSRKTLILKHLMKPSFIPTLTIYGLQVAFLLANMFLVESIFRFPGFAFYAFSVIQVKDSYGIVGVTLVFGIILAIVNALVDIGVAGLDPRIRLKASE